MEVLPPRPERPQSDWPRNAAIAAALVTTVAMIVLVASTDGPTADIANAAQTQSGEVARNTDRSDTNTEVAENSNDRPADNLPRDLVRAPDQNAARAPNQNIMREDSMQKMVSIPDGYTSTRERTTDYKTAQRNNDSECPTPNQADFTKAKLANDTPMRSRSNSRPAKRDVVIAESDNAKIENPSATSKKASWPDLERVTRNAKWPAPVLTDESFVKWSEFIRPTKNDLKWRQIRWHTELEVAAAEAKRLNRPLMLWTMNGHPCGET